MAAPAIQGTPLATQFTSGTDPWTVNLPSSVSAGEGVLVVMRFGAGGGPTTDSLPGGWTVLIDDDTSDASLHRITCLWLPSASGGETSISVGFTAAVKGATLAYRVSGHNSAVTPPISTVLAGTDASLECNAVSLTSGRDYLVFDFMSMDGETQNVTTWPTNYTYDQRETNSGTSGLATTNMRLGVGARQITGAGSSETPGAGTWSASPASGWMTIAIAVEAPVAAQSLVVPPLHAVHQINRSR